MMDERRHEHFAARPGYRVVGAVFGLLLIAADVYVLHLPLDAARIFGAALLTVFGANLVRASWRGRTSWLSRIGPLP